MTRNDAMRLVNESLIDQDTKFTREINALFKQKDVVELMQQAYDMADDNAKMSLMDATEKQFLDKFAKDGSGDDDEPKNDDGSETNDDFELDGSGLDDDMFDEDGSDEDGSDDSLSTPDEGGDMFDMGGDDSNPFADFGGEGGGEPSEPSEPSNPFESVRMRHKNRARLNESAMRSTRKTFRRK